MKTLLTILIFISTCVFGEEPERYIGRQLSEEEYSAFMNTDHLVLKLYFISLSDLDNDKPLYYNLELNGDEYHIEHSELLNLLINNSHKGYKD